MRTAPSPCPSCRPRALGPTGPDLPVGTVCALGGNDIMNRVWAIMELRLICINKLLLK